MTEIPVIGDRIFRASGFKIPVDDKGIELLIDKMIRLGLIEEGLTANNDFLLVVTQDFLSFYQMNFKQTKLNPVLLNPMLIGWSEIIELYLLEDDKWLNTDQLVCAALVMLSLSQPMKETETDMKEFLEVLHMDIGNYRSIVKRVYKVIKNIEKDSENVVPN